MLADLRTVKDQKVLKDELINMLVAGRDTVRFKLFSAPTFSKMHVLRLPGRCLGPYICWQRTRKLSSAFDARLLIVLDLSVPLHTRT